MSEYITTIRWTRDQQDFASKKYSRRHTWQFDGGLTIPASSSPQVVPTPYSDASAVDPEEAFVAALSSCHMLWFLDIACRAGWVVDDYHDAAVGLMARNAEGRVGMIRVTLKPAIPFLLDADRGKHGTLIGHVARANPVWQSLGETSVAVFNGPQAYVSPNWYPSKHANGKAVPTWNYAIAHAHGQARVVDDTQQLLQLLHRLTDQQEASQEQPWKVSDAPPDYITALLKAIVYIEIPVQRWVGKWKVSQNQPADNRQGVATGLRGSSLPSADAMAALVLGERTP